MSNSLTKLKIFYEHYFKSIFGFLIGTIFLTRKYQLWVGSEFNEVYMFIHVNVKSHLPQRFSIWWNHRMLLLTFRAFLAWLYVERDHMLSF